MYDQPAPPLAAVEQEKKSLYHEEELHDKRD